MVRPPQAKLTGQEKMKTWHNSSKRYRFYLKANSSACHHVKRSQSYLLVLKCTSSTVYGKVSLSNIIWFFNHKKLKGVTKKRIKFLTKWGYTELCRVIQMPSENAMTFFLISKLGQNWKEQGKDWWGLAKRSWFLRVKYSYLIIWNF